MAQVLDKGTEKVLVEFTISEYRKLENVIFSPQEENTKATRKYSRAFIDELIETEKQYNEGKFDGPFSTKEEIHTYLNSLV